MCNLHIRNLKIGNESASDLEESFPVHEHVKFIPGNIKRVSREKNRESDFDDILDESLVPLKTKALRATILKRKKIVDESFQIYFKTKKKLNAY